jgi:serine/threonine protein kinase
MTLKVCDFGLARIFKNDETFDRCTRSRDEISSQLRSKTTSFGFGKKRLEELVDDEEKKYSRCENMKMTGRVGTVPYMAPELFMTLHYDKFVDVYAFSMILWELLVCERVWKNEVLVSKIARKVLAGERPSMERINSSLWRCNLVCFFLFFFFSFSFLIDSICLLNCFFFCLDVRRR